MAQLLAHPALAQFLRLRLEDVEIKLMAMPRGNEREVHRRSTGQTLTESVYQLPGQQVPSELTSPRRTTDQ